MTITIKPITKRKKRSKVIKPRKTTKPRKTAVKKPPVLKGEPIVCNLCGPTAWKGAGCPSCPIFQRYHYAEGIEGYDSKQGDKKDVVDYFCVIDTPYISAVSRSPLDHQVWSQGVENTILSIFSSCKKAKEQKMTHAEPSEWRPLIGRYTSAVRCNIEQPGKQVRKSCFPLFEKELLMRANPDNPIFIFALGPGVLQSLGLALGAYSKIQGQFVETKLQDRQVYIFPSTTKKQLESKSGYVEVLRQHVKIFLNAIDSYLQGVPIQLKASVNVISKDYIYPESVEEVRELVHHILQYRTGNKDSDTTPIAIDTETNTVFPHRKKLKILSLVAAWDVGKSTSIPLEHPDTPWTFEQIFPYIDQLLRSPKPKIFHNAKFDIQVLWRKGWKIRNLKWDTMLAEHLLVEDKKGFYGLKDITKLALPAYSGYEEHIEKYKGTDAPPVDKNGLKLRGAAKKLAEDSGFINVPLKELNVYGAIDSDVTLQIAAQQRQRVSIEQRDLTHKRQRYRKLYPPTAFNKKVAKPEYPRNQPLLNIMATRSLPLTTVLAQMELHGMAVDQDYIDNLVIDMDVSLSQAKTQLYQLLPANPFNEPFNPNSVAQLRKILFGFGYTHPETKEIISYNNRIPEEDLKYTKTGIISTDAHFLLMLVNKYDCIFSQELLKYRAAHKARHTFVENIRVLSLEDGRMHTSFHIPGTSTGRLSSSNENMQNIPKQIGDHNIKKIFIPTDPDDMVIVNADAKAAEVRVYAAYSKDPNLIQALNDGMDPHSFFSSMILNPATILHGVIPNEKQFVLDTIGIDDTHTWSYEDFQRREELAATDSWYSKRLSTLRNNIKRVVFGILYGATDQKIALITGITHNQAQKIIQSLFRMFPTLVNYIDVTKRQVAAFGMVETFTGRRRRFNWDALSYYARAKAERQAVNFKIQGTSSDIVLDVLCDVAEPLAQDLKGQLLITVHDSIVAQVPKKYVSQLPDFFQKYGTDNIAKKYKWLPVPFKWDVSVGPSYGELQSVTKYLKNHPIEQENAYDFLEQDIRNELQAETNDDTDIAAS